MTIERFEIDTDTHALVPRVLTDEMRETYWTDASPDQRYDLLLDAAPRPEAGQQTSFAMNALVRKLVDAWNSGWHCNGDDNLKAFESSMAELSSLVAAMPKTDPRPVPTNEFEPNKGCKTPGHCRTAGFCADAWAAPRRA